MKILTICGSPRNGNSQAIAQKLKEILEKKKISNEIILLREKNIGHCDGCVEYCNKELKCKKIDGWQEAEKKTLEANGYIFISPNYFKMPTGIFKDFIDRASIFYTRKTDFSKKIAMVIAVGADVEKEIDACLNNITENFCKTLGIKVIAKKSFTAESEGNPKTLFERHTEYEAELKRLAEILI
jgi:multimeric flavodoxin WrbA